MTDPSATTILLDIETSSPIEETTSLAHGNVDNEKLSMISDHRYNDQNHSHINPQYLIFDFI